VLDPLQALWLAVLQGLTEFLPISSSAHLVIPSLLLGWPDQGLAFDVAVHVGTLSAVLLYYRRDLQELLSGCLAWSRGGDGRGAPELTLCLAVATLPAVLMGLLAGSLVEEYLRSLPVIATTTLVFGLLLWVADRRAARLQASVQLTLGLALAIGIAQALALVPGVSRSGVTITAALLLGLTRQDAARFSFLLSIPVIAGAGLLKSLELAGAPQPVDWYLLLGAAGIAGLTAYACIGLFLRWLDRVGLMPFVYYRVALALLLYAIWII